MSKIFTQLPEELFEHKLFQEIKNNDWRWGIAIILRRASYIDQRDLKKGQVRISLRQLSEEAKITKKQAENLIRHLLGMNTHNKIRGDIAAGMRPILGGQLEGQERGQKKGREIPVYNILLKGFYEIEEMEKGTEKGTEKETPKGTARGHKGDTSPREIATEAKKLEAIKNNQPPNATKSRMVADALESKGFNEDEIRQVKAMRKSTELILQALHYIFADGYVIEKTPIQALKFAILNQPWTWKVNDPKKDPKEVIMEYFSDGKIYNGYTCGINSKGIWFYSGNYTIAELSFDAPLFKANFQKLCEKINIDNPFDKTFKFKEA
jgi:hypothetical protein